MGKEAGGVREERETPIKLVEAMARGGQGRKKKRCVPDPRKKDPEKFGGDIIQRRPPLKKEFTKKKSVKEGWDFFVQAHFYHTTEGGGGLEQGKRREDIGEVGSQKKLGRA